MIKTTSLFELKENRQKIEITKIIIRWLPGYFRP
jgi:hypothetical protein